MIPIEEIKKKLAENQIFDELLVLIMRFMEDTIVYQDIILAFHLRKEPLLGAQLRSEIDQHQQSLNRNKALLAEVEKTWMLSNKEADLNSLTVEDLAKLEFPIPEPVKTARQRKLATLAATRQRLQICVEFAENQLAAAQLALSGLLEEDKLQEQERYTELLRAESLESDADLTSESTKELTANNKNELNILHSKRALILEELDNTPSRSDAGDQPFLAGLQSSVTALDAQIKELTTVQEKCSPIWKKSEQALQIDSLSIRKKLQKQYPSDWRLFYMWYHYRGGVGSGRGAASVEAGMLISYLCNLHELVQEDSSIPKAQFALTMAVYDLFMFTNKVVANMHKIHDAKAGRDNVANIEDKDTRDKIISNSEKPNRDFTDIDNIREKIRNHQLDIGGDSGQEGIVGELRKFADFLETHFNVKPKSSSFQVKAVSFLSRSRLEEWTKQQKHAAGYVKKFREFEALLESHRKFVNELTPEAVQNFITSEVNKQKLNSPRSLVDSPQLATDSPRSYSPSFSNLFSDAKKISAERFLGLSGERPLSVPGPSTSSSTSSSATSSNASETASGDEAASPQAN